MENICWRITLAATSLTNIHPASKGRKTHQNLYKQKIVKFSL